MPIGAAVERVEGNVEPLNALLGEIAGRIATHGSPIALTLERAIALALRGADEEGEANEAGEVRSDPRRLGTTRSSATGAYDAPRIALPLRRLLPTLLTSGTDPLLGPVAACEGRLRWRSSGACRRPAALAARIASVELVGPSGMLRHRAARVGLLLQDAGLDYPWHRHAAEELYLVLHGRARWAAGRAAPSEVPSGGFVHHPPWRVHRMTTEREPLLALWGWTGDIDYERYELVDRATDGSRAGGAADAAGETAC